jgi:hypothetical protein
VDAQLKRKWIEALRSGKYRQTRQYLMDDGGYCCLGVLCVIQGADLSDFTDLETSVLTEYGDYSAGLTQAQCDELAGMNDGQMCEPRSFDHIAGYIQAAILEDQP